MKIGEVARRLGVTERTLRFYESQGLLRPRRSLRGTRRYSEADLQRFDAALKLARHVPLREAVAMAKARPGCASGDEASRCVDALLKGLERDLQSRLQSLAELAADVQSARATVRRCRGCTRPPTRRGCPDCPVESERAGNPLLHLIWEPDAGDE